MNTGLKMPWPELMNFVNNPRSNNVIQIYSHRRQCNTDPQSIDSCETYLKKVLTNPLTLKQLTRIVIRNRIIENMKNYEFVKKFVLYSDDYQRIDANGIDHFNSLLWSNNNNNQSFRVNLNRRFRRTTSMLECLIWQLKDLPWILHQYLYSFPDVPLVVYDVSVFIND